MNVRSQVSMVFHLDKCIGCQLCVTACMDGAHQCIHVPGKTKEESLAAGYYHIPDVVPDRPVTAKGGTPGARIPFIDEVECVGCNLCELVCPVDGCITMQTKRRADDKETEEKREERQATTT